MAMQLPCSAAMRRMVAIVGVTALALIAFSGIVHATDRFAKAAKSGLAIKGYDTTAYHKLGRPQAGNQGLVVEWKGAKWRFATAAEADLFKADPDAYAPQFGAYCTRAMSKGIVIAGKPKIWRLHKGKLYLFYAKVGGEKFDEGPDGMIAKAQTNWAKLKLTE